ncbi:MAG: C39 family peptidase [Chloroflexi bacterium]|nr:C39 family peptidase [Chloroflexota bacterium]
MPRKSNTPPPRIELAYQTQITDSHCGPAVIQMLLANVGVGVTQEQVAEAGGAASTIDMHGMRVDQLAQAVKTLAPEMQFWYKDHSRLNDLIALVSKHRYPVGVEWQGLFETVSDILEDTDTEDEEEDYGHYSVVTYVDRRSRQLIIVDPYKDFAHQDRIFSFDVFLPRWWDTNEVTDPETGRAKLVEDYRMMFLITPKGETFPEQRGMKRF